MQEFLIGTSYFFTYDSDLPAGVGFAIFSRAHIAWLIFAAAGVTAYLLYFRKIGKARQKKQVLAVGILLVSLEVLRILYLIACGHLSVYELPLHLCSLAGYLSLIHACTEWDWLGQTLFAACLPGTAMALVFPDWGMYPAISFISIHGFVFHSLIVLYVLAQLLRGAVKPRITALWKVFVFFCVVVPPIYLFDKATGANYMFVNDPSPGSPLSWLAGFMGNPGYLAGYAVLAAAIMAAMYIPTEIIRHCRAAQ